MAHIGHNNGPTLEPGTTWRTVSWRKARADLLPRLPIEVVRLRVKRAQALGLPYKTYAGIRASTGQDLIGFLFSNNALGVFRPGERAQAEVVQKLAALRDCQRIGLAYKRIDIGHVTVLDRIADAPTPLATWSETRIRLKEIVRETGHPADRFVIVGETPAERGWVAAAQAAGFLTGGAYFGFGA